MILRSVSLGLATLLLTGACHSTKKNTAATVSNSSEPAILLDTIQVKASEPYKKEVYRAANTKLQDIIHTKLEVSFDWSTSRMNGKATLTMRPYFYPSNRLYLNARGMEIKTLEIFELTSAAVDPKKGGKQPLQTVTEVMSKVAGSSFVYENDSLKINLGKTFTLNDTYYVVVDYIAKPNEIKSSGSNAITDDKGLYFINPTGENPFKMPQIWTQGETQANSAWFPTIDSPNEKMTQEILMTVDDKFTTLSNGSLISSVKQVGGTRLDHWKLDQPHSPYLAMMAVGEFKKVTDNPWNGKEISYYVEKDYEQDAIAIFGDTKEMIEFYSNRLGVPYAWPKYSQIAVRDYVSGAMENTSATLHGDFMVYQTKREMIDGKRGNMVIAHELFHQWFGDLVTAESWSNLPLNESFATYGEYLWEEYKSGRDAADYHHWQSKQGYLQSDKEVDLIRFNYKDKEDMFDGFSYNKGGQVLHMLRKAVGDDAFFASLKNYLETNKYKSGEIHNLRLAFEETTGRDMNWFFNEWFLNKGRPKLKVTKNYNVTSGLVELNIEQLQDLKKYPLYTLPLEVDVYVNGKTERQHILLDDQKQQFLLKAATAPQLVNVDAERQLLCDMEYTKSQQEYFFQYHNAPLFEDRYEALNELQSKVADTSVYALFREAALNDKFFAVRNFAIDQLDKGKGDKAALRALLTKIYKNDKNTKTRAKALNMLSENMEGGSEISTLYESALNEASYAICGEALQAIAKTNTMQAMSKAKLFEKESGKDVLFPIAALYGNYGSDDQIPFFHNAIKYMTGFDFMSFCSSYAKTAKRCNTSTSAIAAAMDLEGLGKGANKYIKFASLKALKDIAGEWELREKRAKSAIETAKKENKITGDLEKELQTITETKDILTKMYNRSRS